ncbi:MAG TPA: nuclear transport factor 2 family protein [Thermoleophilia bacterium]|nr:nuclear transport factor 2 family protein [Thermoleophilia bacterium]
MSVRVERAREAMEAFGVHDYDRATALLTVDASWSDIPAGSTIEGRDTVRGYMAEWHKAFSDAHVTNAKYTELSDGRVLIECTGEGRQSGQFGPYPNTGGTFSLPSVLVYSFDDQDRISHIDLYYDTMTMLTQLGHLQARAA